MTEKTVGSEAALKEHWESVYGSKAEDELSWFQARPSVSLELIARTGVGHHAAIVDVGGGASRLVDALLAAGFDRLTVLDVAEGALARARRRLGSQARSVEWIAADVTSWSPRSGFELWHDRAVFHFLTRPEDRERYRAALAKAVEPGGHVIIGTFSATGPEQCSGLPVVRWEPETLADELGPGFRLVEGARDEHVTPGGKVQHFQFSRFVRVPADQGARPRR